MFINQMEITISRRSSQDKYLNKKDNQSLKELQNFNQLRKEVDIRETKATFTRTQRDVSVDHEQNPWSFQNCFKGVQRSSILDISKEIQFHEVESKSLNGQIYQSTKNRSLSRESKIKVASSKIKTRQDQRSYPKSLSKLKDLKSSELQKRSNQLVQRKLIQTTKPKRWTSNTNKSSFLSKNQSQEKLLDNSYRLSVEKETGKKIGLTISKEARQVHFRSQKINPLLRKCIMPLEIQMSKGLSNQKRSFSNSEMIVHSGRSHFHQSSNQLRVHDPLEDLRSLGTEFLKNKMLFSQGKSQKQDILSRYYDPILVIQESNSQYHQSNKKANQIHRSMLNLNKQAQSQSQFSQERQKSQQSIVLQKGHDNVFNTCLVYPSFQKSPIDKVRQEFASSVVENRSISDDDNIWYKMI